MPVVLSKTKCSCEPVDVFLNVTVRIRAVSWSEIAVSMPFSPTVIVPSLCILTSALKIFAGFLGVCLP